MRFGISKIGKGIFLAFKLNREWEKLAKNEEWKTRLEAF